VTFVAEVKKPTRPVRNGGNRRVVDARNLWRHRRTPAAVCRGSVELVWWVARVAEGLISPRNGQVRIKSSQVLGVCNRQAEPAT
jgi:hypothetical protein